MSNFSLPKFVLVDFQYTYGNDESIYIKELAFMGGSSVVPNYFIFKPPFDKRELSKDGLKKNAYCKKYVHGLDWNDGDISYTSVGDILSPLNSYKYVFVFGQTKKNFLKKYLQTNVINLENKTILKKLRSYYTACPIHCNIKLNCAVNNIFKLFVFVEKNYRIFDEYILKEINY